MLRDFPNGTVLGQASRRVLLAALLATTAVATAVAQDQGPSAVTPERLVNAGAEAEAGNWLMVHRTYDSHRFSPLTEVNGDTVGGLKLAFAVPLGGTEEGGLAGFTAHQGTPVVNDGFLYATNPWGTVFKIDVRSGTGGTTVWLADPAVDRTLPDIVVTRGIALLNDHVIQNTLDGRVIALDEATGEVVWERQVADALGECFTGAPLAVADKIVVGQSCGDWGTRGWIEAVNAENGEQVWRFFTVPGPGEPGHETWPQDNEAWKTGGAASWVTGSYDPATNTLFYGTGNPVPMYDPEYRPGDNLYSDSLLALNADTGELNWYFQYTPGDYFDYDEVGVHLLYDVAIDGTERQVVGHFGRNGFFYNLDRTNGSFIHGTQYVEKLTWTEGLDPKTGMPLGYQPGAPLQEYVAGNAVRRDREMVVSCPHIQGGVNFFPTAYNPELMLAYGAGIEGCSDVTNEPTVAENIVIGEIFLGGGNTPTGALTGSITAINATTGEIAAKFNSPFPNHAGVLATGGNLVFSGQLDGTFGAHDGTTLEQVWSINVGTGFKAPPISYAVDGKQYIAILGGSGGSPGATWGQSALDLQQNASMLWVFGL